MRGNDNSKLVTAGFVCAQLLFAIQHTLRYVPISRRLLDDCGPRYSIINLRPSDIQASISLESSTVSPFLSPCGPFLSP